VNTDCSAEGPGFVCDGSGSCVKYPLGAPCNGNNECDSGQCYGDGAMTAGICCDGVCAQKCRSCYAADTGGVDGTCGLVADNNASPDGSCAPYNCDGVSAGCPNTCAGDEDCSLGTCQGMICM
jgi:hypothetical protein